MKLSRLLSLLLVFVLAVSVVGCGDKDTSTSNKKKTKDSENVIKQNIDMEDEINLPPLSRPEYKITPEYDDMTKASVWSTGNNFRLKNAIEKLRSGEKVNLVALGGSITEGQGATEWGDGYAYRFAKKLSKKYAKGDNLNFIDAGICGTPSSLGIMRYERDVLRIRENENAIKPDILILEFAVNDGDEVTARRGYEGIISRTFIENPDCAIIMLFSFTDNGFTVEDDLRPIGEHYGIPMVSMKSAYSTGAITHDEYFFDAIHPGDGGHELMANCLMKLISMVDAEEVETKNNTVSLPPYLSKSFSYMTMIKNENIETEGLSVSLGSFNSSDGNVQLLHNPDGTTYDSFPNNFMNDGTGNDPLVIKAVCSKIMMSYKINATENLGTVDVYVDGQYFAPLQGDMSGPLNMCYTILALDSDEYREHTIEIKMAEGSENKTFTIYSIAYDYREYH